MAEYGVVMKIDPIKGNIVLPNHGDTIGVLSLSFGSSAMRTGGGGKGKNMTSVSTSGVSVAIQAGKWTPELLAATYNSKKFDKVVFFQLAQAVDKAKSSEATVRQQITLEGAYISAINVPMTTGDGDRTASLSFEFDKILYEHGDKSSDFVVRNIVKDAK